MVHFRSTLRDVRIPSSTSGRLSVAGAGDQCYFELAMEPFYQFIGAGVVGCGPHAMDAQEGHEL